MKKKIVNPIIKANESFIIIELPDKRTLSLSISNKDIMINFCNTYNCKMLEVKKQEDYTVNAIESLCEIISSDEIENIGDFELIKTLIENNPQKPISETKMPSKPTKKYTVKDYIKDKTKKYGIVAIEEIEKQFPEKGKSSIKDIVKKYIEKENEKYINNHENLQWKLENNIMKKVRNNDICD